MASDSEKVSQDEIEDLLRQAQQVAGHTPPPAVPNPAAASATIGQSEIEALLKQAPAQRPTAETATATMAPPAPANRSAPKAKQPIGNVGDDIQYLLNQAEQAIASVDQPVDPAISGIQPFEFRDFGGSPASGEKATLELLRDVDLDVRIELGRTQMYLEDVLKLKRGAVVPLDKLAGDPVDVYVNGRLIARGEVLVLNDNFCVRVAELLSSDDV
ncbi:Flagellar motor switch protein FliN [Anatilimnocola aggregata]|uniref:Flagellar motor switch protein FliN n=1 Tax=Anatilimnocola aggregata TaxID=2528021 RepID=A0A517YG43_9BACT|nr:flagellar motor switch protein FliN [Anatilimnocola aggregata]QDU29152.1 Flagellar motor switch protein FliN [Anatilimnocola aggregata]